MNNEFLPQDYSGVPKPPSRYMKFEQGDNTIRILDSAITGYLDWQDKKPVRTKLKVSAIDPAKPSRHFWAFPVWSYATHEVKVLEITQATIQEYIFNLHSTEGWGNPTGYNLNIIRTGEGLETKYNVIAIPPQPVHADITKAWEEVKNAGFDLNRLYTNGDPFSPDSTNPTPTSPQNAVSEASDNNSDEAVEQEVEKIDFDNEPPSPREAMEAGMAEVQK